MDDAVSPSDPATIEAEALGALVTRFATGLALLSSSRLGGARPSRADDDAWQRVRVRIEACRLRALDPRDPEVYRVTLSAEPARGLADVSFFAAALFARPFGDNGLPPQCSQFELATAAGEERNVRVFTWRALPRPPSVGDPLADPAWAVAGASRDFQPKTLRGLLPTREHTRLQFRWTPVTPESLADLPDAARRLVEILPDGASVVVSLPAVDGGADDPSPREMEFFRRRLAPQAVDDRGARLAEVVVGGSCEGARRASSSGWTARVVFRLALAPLGDASERERRGEDRRHRTPDPELDLSGRCYLYVNADQQPAADARAILGEALWSRPAHFWDEFNLPAPERRGGDGAAVDGFASTFFSCRLTRTRPSSSNAAAAERLGVDGDESGVIDGEDQDAAEQRARPRHVYRPSEVIVHLIHDQVFDGTGAGDDEVDRDHGSDSSFDAFRPPRNLFQPPGSTHAVPSGAARRALVENALKSALWVANRADPTAFVSPGERASLRRCEKTAEAVTSILRGGASESTRAFFRRVEERRGRGDDWASEYSSRLRATAFEDPRYDDA